MDSIYKSGNNAHIHKNIIEETGSPIKLDSRGLPTLSKAAQHIGIPNPPDLPERMNRPHGKGIK